MKTILDETNKMRKLMGLSLLTESSVEPDVVVRGNPSRLIDLTNSKKGLKVYKKMDIDHVQYYTGGRLVDPNKKEEIATIQPDLTDDEVIDFLYKNRNSSGAYRGFGKNS
jgi:hypothetical protein